MDSNKTNCSVYCILLIKSISPCVILSVILVTIEKYLIIPDDKCIKIFINFFHVKHIFFYQFFSFEVLLFISVHVKHAFSVLPFIKLCLWWYFSTIFFLTFHCVLLLFICFVIVITILWYILYYFQCMYQQYFNQTRVSS